MYTNEKKPETEEKVPEREKRVEKIVTGKVSEVRKSPVKNFLKTFLAEDLTDIGKHFIWDVIVPEIRSSLYNTAKDGVDMLFLGSARRKGVSGSGKPKVSYSGAYSSANNRSQSLLSSRSSTPDYDDILFETLSDANDVLDTMIDIIGRYGQVTVADFYDLIDKESKWTENKYGWTNLGGASVKRVSGGYTIVFPKATLI